MCQFYREHSLLRGDKSIPGSNAFEEQKNRLLKWIRKMNQVVNEENKDIVAGGDFNADMLDVEGDVFATILQEELIDVSGLAMIVDKITHQEIKKRTAMPRQNY